MADKDPNVLKEETIINELTYPLDEDGEEEETTILPVVPPPVSDPNICIIIKDGFGLFQDAESDECTVVHRFTLKNKNGVTVQIITYGATIISVKTPDNNGHFDDIVMGYDNIKGYRSERNPYFGATIGRVTGIIPNCIFSIAGEEYRVANNFMETHHANGGLIGFDKVMWNANISDGKLFLSYMSRDCEEGFPGDVVVNRSYELTPDDELIVETSAHCSKQTPLDVSTHVDWNLASHLSGPKELYKHYLMINADQYAQLNKQRMMTGKLKKVGQTVFDLRIPRPLGRIIHRVPGGGYDHYMQLIRGPEKKSVTFAAKLIHPDNGRFVEVMSDQPGIFVYTQNNLYAEQHIIEAHPVSCWCHDPLLILEQKKIQNPTDMSFYPKRSGNPCSRLTDVYGPIDGKFGAAYRRHGGIRLVPVNYPEPVSRHYKLSSYLLRPGQTYLNTTIYKFGNTYDKKYDPLGECVLRNIVL